MAPPKSLGEFKFRIRFDKQETDQSDPAGGSLANWKEQFTRWARIEPLQGSEPVIAQRLQGTQPVLIMVRYDSDTMKIDPSWRAVEMRDGHAFKYYALKTAEDMERERYYITMMAVAGVADA